MCDLSVISACSNVEELDTSEMFCDCVPASSDR